jgi:hypothetical protein
LESDYRPPAILAEIAWDYSQPHVVKKAKAPRAIYRHADWDAGAVRKYTYRSWSFALGAMQLGLPGTSAGPIALTPWDFTWNAPPQQGNIVSNHPYRDTLRFSTFLCDHPKIPGGRSVRASPTCSTRTGCSGASPFERMMQHEGAAIVLYRIPAVDEAPYVNVFLPHGLRWIARDGRLLADAGTLYVGVRPIGAYRWDEIVASVGNPLHGDRYDVTVSHRMRFFLSYPNLRVPGRVESRVCDDWSD